MLPQKVLNLADNCHPAPTGVLWLNASEIVAKSLVSSTYSIHGYLKYGGGGGFQPLLNLKWGCSSSPSHFSAP